MRRTSLSLAFALLVGTAAAQTQAPATLVADQVNFNSATSTVSAAGHVEILYGTTRLTATRITYRGATDQIEVVGPIHITDGDTMILVADFAELSADLQDGVLRGARLVLDRQLQIAAADITRAEGRYTRLNNTVASSCQTCAKNPVPIWQIRAARVTHDQLERSLLFENARLELLGVPILYAPRLRLPDPTVKRASGFLTPTIRTTNQLGTGVKIPYFLTLGDHADLTFTPYVTTKNAQTLELRYRHRFAAGGYDVTGAITKDDLTADSWRGYLFANGQFDLPADFDLSFDLELTSDRSYLLDYGYSSKDRLDSSIGISRTRRDQYIGVELTGFQSLRSGDVGAEIPSIVTSGTYRQRFTPGLIGGQAGLTFQEYSYYRSSDADIVGRDATRASVGFDWQRSWMLANGMIVTTSGEVTADFFRVYQDSTYSTSVLERVTPVGAVTLRWPWARQDANGVSHVIEPIVQAVFSPDRRTPVPNEDSTLIEFDEGNLFSFSRFPGADAREAGNRLNIGMSYTRIDPAGWTLGVTAGRILRERDLNQFTDESGLSGDSSDWMAAVQLGIGPQFNVINRALFDDDFNFGQNELRFAWHGPDLQLSSGYVWIEADPAESRPYDTSELTFDAAWRLQDNWVASTDWRYDFQANRATRGGIGLTYETECIRVDLSLSRRFTSSTIVTPTTDFGLSVELLGFGSTPRANGSVRRCNG